MSGGVCALCGRPRGVHSLDTADVCNFYIESRSEGMDVNSPEAALWSENMRLKSTLEWVSTALPILETMCRSAGLSVGAAKAREMIEHVASVKPEATEMARISASDS